MSRNSILTGYALRDRSNEGKWGKWPMKDRWVINVDLEGFSKNYEYSEDRKTFAILALCELIDAIFRIGTFYYPGDPERN